MDFNQHSCNLEVTKKAFSLNWFLGVTSSKVHELMREAQKETTNFMIEDIADHYGVKNINNLTQKYVKMNNIEEMVEMEPNSREQYRLNNS